MLNANYLLAQLKDAYELPFDRLCMRDVLSARTLKRRDGITALDVAKRLMDYDFHPPTIYFPLIVPEALMIEPTETEAKETLDDFVEAMLEIVGDASGRPEVLKEAPHHRPVGRVDEVKAAKRGSSGTCSRTTPICPRTAARHASSRLKRGRKPTWVKSQWPPEPGFARREARGRRAPCGFRNQSPAPGAVAARLRSEGGSTRGNQGFPRVRADRYRLRARSASRGAHAGGGATSRRARRTTAPRAGRTSAQARANQNTTTEAYVAQRKRRSF